MLHNLPGPVPNLGRVDPWWRWLLFAGTSYEAVVVWLAVSLCRRWVRTLEGGQGG